jgi:transcriptional regulator of arginine metabolism
VMKTLPGNANTVAALIDGLSWPEIMGTIAGDDTILIICRSKENSKEVTDRIMDML